jgi:hypothetical protein
MVACWRSRPGRAQRSRGRGAGARILGGDATQLITVDLDGRQIRDILAGANVFAKLPTRDFADARFGIHRMLANYARGRGAYQWVANDAIAVAVYHATGPGTSLVVMRIDRGSGRVVKAQVALSKDSEIDFVHPFSGSRFFVASRGDFPRSLVRCEVFADDVDCRPFDLGGVLARAGLTNWESSIRRASFNDQGSSFRVIADSAEGRCLAAVDLDTAKYRCLVRNLDKLSPLGSGFVELFLPSPDDRWLAYTVESGGNASNIFDIYLLPLR